MDKMKHRRLQELDRSDFEIIDGEPDIRGWDVRNSEGRKIGEVEELIVDAQQKKVRYMVVDLDDNELKLDHRKVLLPIGMAVLHEKDDDVILPQVQESQLRMLPDYDDDDLTPDIERKIFGVMGSRSTTASSATSMTTSSGATQELPDDFYTHEYYNSDNLYKNRMHEAQSVNQPRKESDYEKGLRLWERRSEGGLMPDESTASGTTSSSRDTYRGEGSRVNEDARMEMVRNRRREYEQRRTGGGLGRDTDSYQRKDNTIEGRIRDEGLRDG
jgi:sporulation protein YlmC with PRC-barrel domain